MKATGGLLHAELSRQVAELGHGDLLVLADAGLPRPRGSVAIDLAVSPGTVSLYDVARAVATEMRVERIEIASELYDSDASLAESITRLFAGAELVVVDHATFKLRTSGAACIVRTGEYTPYANVALYAGVPF